MAVDDARPAPRHPPHALPGLLVRADLAAPGRDRAQGAVHVPEQVRHAQEAVGPAQQAGRGAAGEGRGVPRRVAGEPAPAVPEGHRGAGARRQRGVSVAGAHQAGVSSAGGGGAESDDESCCWQYCCYYQAEEKEEGTEFSGRRCWECEGWC